MALDFYDFLGMLSIFPKDQPETLSMENNIPACDEVKQQTEQPRKPTEITPVKYNYRPITLDAYTGQKEAKENIRLNYLTYKRLGFFHLLISGFPGCGKSTLANIVINELGLIPHYYIGGNFTMTDLIDFLNKNQQDRRGTHALFIDEIHGLNKEIAEVLYPITEDFKCPLPTSDGKDKLYPFVFIGATTEKNLVQRFFAPLLDRIRRYGSDIILEPYTIEDMIVILKNYNDQVYKVNVTSEVYQILARNVRFTPRIALGYFDKLMACNDLQRVLKADRIIKDSLTTTDIAILKRLQASKRAIGERTLATAVNVTSEDYRLLIEPFLLQQDFINCTARGRELTTKGKELLEKLEKQL